MYIVRVCVQKISSDKNFSQSYCSRGVGADFPFMEIEGPILGGFERGSNNGVK